MNTATSIYFNITVFSNFPSGNPSTLYTGWLSGDLKSPELWVNARELLRMKENGALVKHYAEKNIATHLSNNDEIALPRTRFKNTMYWNISNLNWQMQLDPTQPYSAKFPRENMHPLWERTKFTIETLNYDDGEPIVFTGYYDALNTEINPKQIIPFVSQITMMGIRDCRPENKDFRLNLNQGDRYPEWIVWQKNRDMVFVLKPIIWHHTCYFCLDIGFVCKKLDN